VKTITDEFMREMMTRTREYTAVVLKRGPRFGEPGADKVIWEHGRRNFSLRAEGLLRIVCPIRDGSEVAGIGIFVGSVEETERLMREDPAIAAGILVHEVHSCRSFPGDALPE
jgi:hypothetical protein